ncbi:MAG: acylphosphatase [Anaerolineales bacterium]
MSEKTCAHIFITGKVQGVGFRAFTRATATELGIFGWVRNLGYDEVECMLEGERAVLEALIAILQRGPRAGRVDNLAVEWLPASGKFSKMEIHASA